MAYNERTIGLFVLKKSNYTKASDLFGKVVTGDRHSAFEKYLGQDRKQIRVIDTKTKEESFQKFKEGTVEGVIAPIEVGHYMARKLKMEVFVIQDKAVGTPVSIAVAKGNTCLQN